MKSARLTIGGALGLVALAALCFAGLRSRSLLWAQFFFTGAIGTLLIVTIGAIVAKHRAVLIGASIVGWGYWICVFAPGFQDSVRPWLLSTALIDQMFLNLVAPTMVTKNNPRAAEYLSIAAFWKGESNYMNFSRIAQAISTLIHALQGAIVGWLFDRYRRRHRIE
jgi:hypothetical protein